MTKNNISDLPLSQTVEVFTWKDISIFQNHHVLKIGTDAILLGAWVPKVYSGGIKVLDAGTGNGIISLMMASQLSDVKIDAVDSNDQAVLLAELNFKNSPFSGKLKAFQCDIFSGVHLNDKYDLVVCNPPYFFHQFPSPSKMNKSAKHAQIDEAGWMKALIAKLKKRGELMLVVPFATAHKWISEANASGMFCNQRLNVYSFASDMQPVRSLLHFSDRLIKPEINSLIVYSEQKTFTNGYIDFTGIGTGNKA